MAGEWREVVWTDENNREIKRLACHETELEKVLNLPFPEGAAAREPVYELTNIGQKTAFFKRKPLPYKIGEMFVEHINQGDRMCKVLAVHEESGDYLYDYEMPGGRVFLRNRRGRPISRTRIPKKFDFEGWEQLNRNMGKSMETCR